MPELDWTKGIKIPKGLPPEEIDRWIRDEKGEQPPTGRELGLELPLNTPEIPNDRSPRPETDEKN